MRTRGATMISESAIPPHALISQEARDLFAKLAAGGGQPNSEESDAATELLNLGLLREDPAVGYILVDPQYVGAQWQGSFYRSAALMLEQASTVSDALFDLRHAYNIRAADSAGLVEYHRGSEAINCRMSQILSSCVSELLVCQPGGPRRVELLQEAAERDLDALKRGVEMRTIYHEHARSGPAMDAWVRSMTAAGAQIRTLGESFERMFIIDRRIAVIPGDRILTDSAETIAYVVNDSGVANFLARQFERDWVRASDWNQQAGLLTLTDRQVAILRGLAAGESQAAIGRRLEIKQRAMAVAISELKELFGAETLFELACRWMSSVTGAEVPG
jgi:DNA-binding CsgD family transcriptional regulator